MTYSLRPLPRVVTDTIVWEVTETTRELELWYLTQEKRSLTETVAHSVGVVYPVSSFRSLPEALSKNKRFLGTGKKRGTFVDTHFHGSRRRRWVVGPPPMSGTPSVSSFCLSDPRTRTLQRRLNWMGPQCTREFESVLYGVGIPTRVT